VYNLITFETPSNSLSYSLSLRGTKNKATDTLVIASLNTKGVQAWQSPILGRIVIHSIKEKIARSEATKQSHYPTLWVGESCWRSQSHLRLPRAPVGSPRN